MNKFALITTKEANTKTGYEDAYPGSIGEQALSNALGTLCPLWPFCEEQSQEEDRRHLPMR